MSMTRRLLAMVILIALISSSQTLLLAQSVEGVLVTTSGSEVVGAEVVFVQNETLQEVTVTTGEKGGFSVDLVPGEYRVYRTLIPERVYLARVRVDEGQTKTIRIVAPQGDDPSLASIRNFSVNWNDREAAVKKSDLSDLINPFPARKQGRWYGSIYEFHRNDNLDARNFFDPVGEPLPEYKRNQFGGTLGWLASPELTIQGSFDGLRIVQGSTLLSHVPTPAQRNGDFSELEAPLIDPLSGAAFPGGRIPEDRISPVARQMLPVIPTPNRSDPDRNFVNNDPLVRNQDHFDVRADYETQSNSTYVFSYQFTDADRALVRPFPEFNSERNDRDQSGALTYNKSLSDRLLAFLRVGVARSTYLSLSRNSNRDGLLDSLGINGVAVQDSLEEGYPEFNLTGYTDFGDRRSPSNSVVNRFWLDTSGTYVFGSHTFRGGMDWGTRQLNSFRSDGLHRGEFVFNGTFSGDAFADFLLGFPDRALRGIGSDRVDLRRQNWQFFFRDQWKVTPRLDVTLGISYEYVQPYHSIRNNVSGFYPLVFEPPLDGKIIIAGTEQAAQVGLLDTFDGTLVYPDRNDWSPNLGFAFSPLGSNRLVVRGTYTVWYDTPSPWYSVEATRNYPFYFVESVEASSQPIIDLEKPFELETERELTVNGISPRARTPYFSYWRLSVENEIFRNWNLEVRYVGRKGTNLLRTLPGNVPTPGEGSIQERRPNPAFGKFDIFTDNGNFTGHALDLQAERRLVDGLSLRSGFEWNRIIDDNFGSNPQDPRNLKAEKASASWVPVKRFFLNYIIDLPVETIFSLQDGADWLHWMTRGWRLSGITEIHDGRPFTVTSPGDPNNDGVYGDRPDRVGSGVLPSAERSVDAWFDTSVFEAAEEFGFGNSGRNILVGPGYQSWDVSVIKQTRFSDGDLLEFRVEFFNAFNHVNFERPNSEFGNSLFGKIFGAERAREIELALKYSF